MSIQKKLFLGITAIIAILISLSIVEFFVLGGLVEKYNEINNKLIPKMSDITGLRARAMQTRAEFLQIYINDDPSKFDEYYKIFIK